MLEPKVSLDADDIVAWISLRPPNREYLLFKWHYPIHTACVILVVLGFWKLTKMREYSYPNEMVAGLVGVCCWPFGFWRIGSMKTNSCWGITVNKHSFTVEGAFTHLRGNQKDWIYFPISHYIHWGQKRSHSRSVLIWGMLRGVLEPIEF